MKIIKKKFIKKFHKKMSHLKSSKKTLKLKNSISKGSKGSNDRQRVFILENNSRKRKHYDCMIAFKSTKTIKKLSYLPFKSINEETNSSVYRLIIAKKYNDYGYSSLQMTELEIPNEGKVMEVKDKSFLSNETDSSNDIFTQKFDMKKLKEIRVKEEISDFKNLPHKIGFVVVGRVGEGLSLYDFGDCGKLESELDFSKEIINLEGKGGYAYVRNF